MDPGWIPVGKLPESHAMKFALNFNNLQSSP